MNVNAEKVIKKHGGPTALAKKLGYESGGAQRVHNWLTRGIPAQVILENIDIFKEFLPNKK